MTLGQVAAAPARPAAARGGVVPLRTIARIAVGTLLTFLPPILAFRLLSAAGGIAYPLLYGALIEGLFVHRLISGGQAPRSTVARLIFIAAPWLRGLLLAGGALIILVGLNITPASAYLAWFTLVRKGLGTGTLSYMFTVDFAYFSSLFAGLFIAGNAALPLFGYAFTCLFLVAVILETPLLNTLVVALLLGAVAYKVAVWVGKGARRAFTSALLLILTIVLFALPLAAKPGRNPLFDLVYRYPLNAVVAGLFPNFPFLYNVPGYGYSLDSGRLGAPPALTATPVFRIEGQPGETIYLRTAVYDTYTGDHWLVSGLTQRLSMVNGAMAEETPGPDLPIISYQSDRYRAFPFARLENWPDYPAAFRPWGWNAASDEDLPGSQRYFRETAGRNPPPDQVAPPLRPITQVGTREPPLTVTVLTDFFAALPHTLHTVAFRFPGEARPGLQYGSLDTGFLLSVPMIRGTTIVLDRRLRFAPSGAPPERDPDPIYRLSRIQRLTDLQVGMVTPEVRALARSLRQPTEAETIVAIRNYLTQNYVYSLDTQPPKPDESLVDQFLFHTRKGYCVQFATAFVVLARLDQIPARYVTGFLAYLPPHEKTMVVTGLDAHAWAEVWDDRSGWTIEEATPPMLASAVSDPSYYTDFNPTDNPATLRQLQAIMGNRVDLREGSPLKGSPGGTRIRLDLLHVLAAGGALLLLAGLAWLLGLALQSREARTHRLIRALARNAGRVRLPVPDREGWRAWGRVAASRDPHSARLWLRASALILRHSFGGRDLSRRDATFLRAFSRRIGRRPRSLTLRR